MNLTKTAGRSIFILPFLIIFFSCKTTEQKDEASDIKVNPEFEMAPPVAEDVMVKKIKGDDKNLLVIAKFRKGQLKEKYLAFYYDTSKLVMRDDGKRGDEIAGDGLFTVTLNTKVKEFKQTITDLQKQPLAGKRFVFKGRSIITDTIKHEINLEKLNAADMISIKHLPFPPAPASLKDHSLMITDLNVVEDPTRTYNFCTQTGNIDGPWTFKTLMKELAKTSPGAGVTDVQLSDFVETFFRRWTTNESINGEIVNRRSGMERLLQSWSAKSQILPLPRVPNGKLDLRAIPVKLLAIVNRLDLRGNSGYGTSNAGQGRLVFCLMTNDGCTPLQFNIIFEYGVPKEGCNQIKAYAHQWYDLKDIAFTDPQFNIRLQAITDQFTLCGTSPLKPNQSSLNQVRSDEFAFDSPPWELREFNLDNMTHLLKSVTVKQTPAVKFNVKLNNTDVQMLAAYINTNEAAILANNYIVPKIISGTSFLGGHAHNGRPILPPIRPVGMPLGEAPTHWNGFTSAGMAFINSDDARQVFSLNTCSGCHGGETQTSFTMIDPVPYGTQATLAGFLSGTPGIPFSGITPVDLDGANGIMNVPDPAGRASSNDLRKFSDLQRRADDLQDLVFSICISVFRVREILMHQPMKFVD